MPVPLFSAPNEEYIKHIARCREKFEIIFPIYYPTIARILNISLPQDNIKDYLLNMILFHDLGKLTKKWQANLGKNRKMPSHSTLGAAYLWKTLPGGLKEPISFGVAIHHTDKGLLGDNIEKPDVQAILDGIVDNSNKILWDEKIENLSKDYFPDEVKNLNILDLKEMARGLRVWSRGCGLLEQHQRRIQACLLHHILKLCDISAARERSDWGQKDNLYGGWLMVQKIVDYVERIGKRK